MLTVARRFWRTRRLAEMVAFVHLGKDVLLTGKRFLSQAVSRVDEIEICQADQTGLLVHFEIRSLSIDMSKELPNAQGFYLSAGSPHGVRDNLLLEQHGKSAWRIRPDGQLQITLGESCVQPSLG